MPQSLVFEGLSEEKRRVDLFLAEKTGMSRAHVQEAIKAGNVKVNGKPVKASYHLKNRDTVVCDFSDTEKMQDLAPVKGELDILFEDESLIVLNKAQGVIVHPSPTSKKVTLVHHLLYHLKNNPKFLETSPTRPGIVHRLDRGTSGVLIIAKNRKVHEELSRQFKAREVKKNYEAIVWGVMKEAGTFRSVIGRDIKNRKKMSSKTTKGRDAVTKWEKISDNGIFTHVDLFPHTGRTHQLRVHLSEGKHSVVGDDLYGVAGAKRRTTDLSNDWQEALNDVTQTLLHAKSLEFTHPASGKRMLISADRPEKFNLFLEKMS